MTKLNNLMNIESPVIIKVSDLKQHPKNPRKQNQKAMEFLRKSIDKLGSFRPLLVNHKNEVLAGNQLLSVLQEKGIDEVVCIYPKKELTAAEEKHIIVADNQNSFHKSSNQWDIDIFANEFDFVLEDYNLDFSDIDFTLDTSGEEVKKTETDEKDDNVPEPKKQYTFVKEGDIWLLGGHRLACIDSTDVQAVERLMDGKKANMAFTDPPYNTGMQAKDDSTRLNHMFSDKFNDNDWQNLLQGFTSTLFLVLQDNSVAYICLDWRRNHELIPYIKTYFHLSNVIVWDKVVHGLGSDYKYTYELINVCKKGKPELNTNHGDKDYQDIWHIQRKIGRDEEHATKKPIEIITRAISHASKQGDIILDLFCGSGSTLIACEKTERICYTSELLPHYCGVAIHRYAKYKNSYDDIFLLQDGKKISYNELMALNT